MITDICPDCQTTNIRRVSSWNKDKNQWDWVIACNICKWEEVNEDLTNLHLADNQ